VINVGSIGGLHIPNWEAHPYGASKAAVHHVTRSLAKSLGHDYITVNAIAPGPFPSKMHDTSSEATQKSIATYIPLGRAGTPEDAEGAVVFLSSRAGSYVNGHVLPLDGGYVAALEQGGATRGAATVKTAPHKRAKSARKEGVARGNARQACAS
jgi:NAD(P)-dependent dehydrogenase (short-subunit alcohol dehydrogenase family)